MKQSKILSKALLSIAVSGITLSSGCSRPTSQSKIKVSDVQHSPVKRQSIGNCWLYATATWAESMHLAATGDTVNISESYWTYWDWYDKLVNSYSSELNTGGNWWDAGAIIEKHGYMLEGDFIPNEADAQMSLTQRSAETAIQAALKDGSLKSSSDRTSENVIKALDAAFGVNMAALASKVHPSTDLKTNGTDFTLADEIPGGRHAWQVVNYSRLWGKDATETTVVRNARAKVLRRVLTAVNDKKPVIMSSMVDFAALNTSNNATFEYDRYINAGRSGGQGGHLIVLEDYVVDDVPGIGHIGEGDVSPDLKKAALNGTVKYLVVKNSWGTDRPDRGLSDGYTRFEMDFLNRPLPFSLPEHDTDISHGTWYSALSSFVVPPEY